MKALSEEVLRPGFLTRNLKEFDKFRLNFRDAAKAVGDQKELAKLSNLELLRRYNHLKDAYLSYTIFFWYPWAINEQVAPQFYETLKRKFGDQAEVIYQAVTIPTKLILMEQQKLELLEHKYHSNLVGKIDSHVKKYQWLAVYSLLDGPYTKKDFIDMVSRVRNSKVTIKQSKEKLLERQRQFRGALVKLRREPKLLRIAKILNVYAWLRTERVDIWREILFLSQPFYHELARRLGWKPNETPHLSYQEVVDFLKSGTKPPKEARRGGELTYLRNGKLKIVRNARQIKRIVNKELGQSKSRQGFVKGEPAFMGKVKGRVRLVFMPEECNKLHKGDILVSNMTHPDYFMGMVRAGAIVTDEGGVSCHAAIVARELKKPCVIGTKLATSVFRDGDMVEVDAIRGVVKKI